VGAAANAAAALRRAAAVVAASAFNRCAATLGPPFHAATAVHPRPTIVQHASVRAPAPISVAWGPWTG